MKRLNAGPLDGPARNAYIQTGPFVGGEVLNHPFIWMPQIYASGAVNNLSQVVVLTCQYKREKGKKGQQAPRGKPGCRECGIAICIQGQCWDEFHSSD
jgi:hypothetical protein